MVAARPGKQPGTAGTRKRPLWLPPTDNVGSGLGSFGRVHDPERPEFRLPGVMAYAASKSAVSMLTVHYAQAHPGLRVNVVDPGPTATDLNGHRGSQTVEEGAEAIVRAALLSTEGPTGTFSDAAGVSPW
ncbi:SDR family NAD(P)-dependent oxidoreductase [Streptomyces albidoflavus]